ncbi:hypothetical protein BC829DRAFT_389850 [Chytridium lagenaria]|nr:hypothetical protein BC829DRAFT_389850 [Chytridium lagenaria]
MLTLSMRSWFLLIFPKSIIVSPWLHPLFVNARHARMASHLEKQTSQSLRTGYQRKRGRRIRKSLYRFLPLFVNALRVRIRSRLFVKVERLRNRGSENRR